MNQMDCVKLMGRMGKGGEGRVESSGPDFFTREEVTVSKQKILDLAARRKLF